MKTIRPFMAMLVADWFEPDALSLARREGILVTTPSLLFGDEVGKGIKNLVAALANAAEVAMKRPEVIEQLFAKLSSIEGAANNLRGPLFEKIVGHCVREKEGNTIEIGKEVRSLCTGNRAEIDVLRVKEKQEVCCYECKAHSPNVRVSGDEVEKWLTETIPTIRDHMKGQERYENLRQIFEFWTTGVFDPDALALLQDRQAQTKKYTITWRDKTEVGKYLRGIQAKYLAKILDEHYFNHPLTKAGETKEKSRSPKSSQESAVASPASETAALVDPVTVSCH